MSSREAVESSDFSSLFAAFKNSPVGERQKSASALNLFLQKYLQAKNFENSLDYKTITDLFETICENLTDAKPGYTNILKDLLKQTISLRNILFKDESYEQWVRFITAFPAASKALYHALEPLAKYIPNMYAYGLNESLYTTAFSLFPSLQVASPVGKCLCALLRFRGNAKEATQEELGEWVRMWSPYLYATFGTRGRENVLIYVLGPMLRQTPAAFLHFYENVPGSVENKIGCLKTANDVGIDVEPLLRNDETLVSRLHDHSRFLRFEVLSLLLASKQVAKPIPSHIYNIIKENADVLFAEANPKFRNQVFAVVRKFLFRIRSSSYALARDAKENVDPQVGEAKEFLQWLSAYMLKNIQPGCPYRCLVTGFQYLDLMLVNGVDKSVDKKFLEPNPVNFPFSIDLFTPEMMLALINNVPNDYYDIRQLSAKLIQIAPKPAHYLASKDDVDKLAEVSRSLISGVRGRQGDGGARISQIAYLSYQSNEERLAYLERLMDETMQGIEAAEANIRTACQEHGLHGYFEALALICEVADFAAMPGEGLHIVNKLIKMVTSVWDITWDTLTNSAPEGNIPMPLDAMLDDEANEIALSGKYGATAQVLLSFSWRAVKESAALLTVLIQKFAHFEQNQLKGLLSLIVRQLTSLRHRGAYSSIAPAYEALCYRFYRSHNESLQNLPLEMVNNELDNVITKTQLITRRSAGLPMLITGAIATNPHPKPALESIMRRLHEISKLQMPDMSESMKLDLPQVHAFNCLRATLRDSRLSKATDEYVETALILAIEAFNSPIWSIRNCGVMLFSTLHIRLFGSSSTMGAGVFFNRFKAIKPLLYDHLVKYVSQKSSADLETVYPILALLLRLRSIGENSGLDVFCAPIIQFLSSNIWKVREMSAWVLAAILHESQIAPVSLELFENCSIKNQNTMHGHLMALNAINSEFSADFVELAKKRVNELFVANKCCETKIELVKLYRKLRVSTPERPLMSLKALQPSQRVLNSLLAVTDAQDDKNKLLEYMRCGQRDVIESMLDLVHDHFEELVDERVYAEVVKLLSNPNPSIKSKCLDIIAKVGSTSYSVKYENISDLVYNSIEPLSTQQRALKCLGSLVPEDSELQTKWETTIEQFCDEESPLDSRLCAVESIKSYVENHRPSSRLLWQVYMLLSDDEEIIRTATSKFASQVIGGVDFAPRYCERPILQLVGADYVRSVFNKRDVDAEIAAAKSSDETLFVSEKANLYRNDFVQMDQIRDLLHIPLHAAGARRGPFGESGNGDLQIALARKL